MTSAYHANGGSNLVIVDGRNPVDIFLRNDIVGSDTTRVRADSILSIYLDDSVEMAASWAQDNYEDSLANVCSRRMADATRSEYPMTRPNNCITDFSAWLSQFPHVDTETGLAQPLRIDNNRLSLEAVHGFAGYIAAAAHDTAGYLYASRQPGYTKPNIAALLHTETALVRRYDPVLPTL